MKLVKKLLAGGLLSTVILANSVLSVGACRCPDNCNYEDIYKSVWLNNGSSTEIYYGEKNNSHSVYFQFCSDCTAETVRVSVYGISHNSSAQPNETYSRFGKVDYVTVHNAQTVQIYNKINEHGYQTAGLKVKNSGSSGRVNFNWSPDYCQGYDGGNTPVAS